MAKNLINELNDLRQQIKNMPSTPGTQMVPACCEPIFVRLSQHYLYNNTVLLYGSHDNPREAEAKRYGLCGMNRIVVPSNPLAYRNGRDARDDYRDARDEFKQDVLAKCSEMNAILKQLEDGGPMGSSGGRRNIIKGLSDPRSITLHGRIRANELRQQSNENLANMIDSLANVLSNQYTSQQLATSRMQLGEIRTRCATFRLCLDEAGGKLADRDDRRNAIRQLLQQLIDNIGLKNSVLEGRINNLRSGISRLDEEISILEETIKGMETLAIINASILSNERKQYFQNQISQARQNLQTLRRQRANFRGS